MVFAVKVVGVQTGFLQSGLGGFANLLLLGLLHSYFVLLVDNLLGYLLACRGHGVHGGYLKGYLTAYSLVYAGLAETYNRGELVVEVVVGGYCGSLHILVSAEFHLLACLAYFVGDEVCDSAAVDGDVLHLVQALGGSEQGRFKYFLGQGAERLVVGDEVCLALQGYHSGKTFLGAGEYATLGSLAVFTLGGHGLAFLADNLDGCLQVAVGLCQGVLAVHHACAGHLAQFLYIFNRYCHFSFLCF